VGVGTTQSPAPEEVIDGREVQEVLEQIPLVDQIPKEQEAERTPVKPELQIGVQLVPSRGLAVQSPGPELAIVGIEGQLVPVHNPVVDHTPD